MPSVADFEQLRADVVAHLRRQYLGPAGGEHELLVDRPDRTYLVGTLYPRGPARAPQEGDTLGEEAHDDQLDEPIELANAWHPASAAISFLHTGHALDCTVSAAHYARRVDPRGWQRTPLISRDIMLDPRDSTADVLDGRARLVSIWRPVDGGHLVTVALENTGVNADASAEPDTETCLFQAQLLCRVRDGHVRPYPSVSGLSDDPEEQELRLLYRRRRVYGVGHGCSVRWQPSSAIHQDASGADIVDAGEEPSMTTVDMGPSAREPGPPAEGDGPPIVWVATEMMPQAVVAGVSPGEREDPVLRLVSLADPDRDATDLAADLREFVGRYSDWIEDQHRQIQRLVARSPGHGPAAQRILARLEQARTRMGQGVALLEDPQRPDVLTAFRLATTAMREQILQTGHARRHPGARGSSLSPRDPRLGEPAWYPFQLAFQLLTLASVVDPRHDDRDVVDLIWFPTGGGKTEAYLAVAAFEMIHRRLTRGLRGGGTAVITRYTLRMLTAQQFQRAATLICALDLLRREHPRLQGSAPFTVGLWVGSPSTPNTFEEALEQSKELLKATEPDAPFQVAVCPWCATPLAPARRSTDKSAYGVRATKRHFELHCTHTECPFADVLPILVVDEQIFAEPPTMLVATVDKFARVAWVANSGTLFGRGNQPHDPPSLIIQDELHLLSGPLGTTVALYESALLGLIAWGGERPKIIASTATIRSAVEQVRQLYGEPVALFPPSGLDADDSHYATVDTGLPGRLYLGLMPQAHTASYATVLACLALLTAPAVAETSDRSAAADPGPVPDPGPVADPSTRDAYWTLVAYHNSLRELGRTVTLARDDVATALKRRAYHDPTVRTLTSGGVIELTSNVDPNQLIKFMRQLERGVDQPDCIDLVATTNMLSVGIDISRLGLMLMNGQPKTTAEYIQATSRVGRSSVPGLVVTLLRANRPRDRSHYESFIAYHDALYRHVEPTSVTPWSLASRDRSLRAALVILIRHGAGLTGNAEAAEFRADDARTKKAVTILLRAVTAADPEAAPDTENQLRHLVAEWDRRARESVERGFPLRYDSSDNEYPALLRDFGERKDGWSLNHSMRSVDRQVRVKAIGEA